LKKLMMLAAMLAMVMVAAVPALAQDASTGDDNSIDDSNNVDVNGDDNNVGINDCQQFLQQSVLQSSNQSAAVSGDGEIAQGGNNVSAEQYQACINALENDVNGDEDQYEVIVDEDEDGVADEGDECVGVQYGEADNGSELNQNQQVCVEDSEQSITTTDTVDIDGDGDVAETSASAAASAASSSSSSASSGSGSSGGGSGSTTQLPATGGVSLLTLGAGALLVGGGLVARRIVR